MCMCARSANRVAYASEQRESQLCAVCQVQRRCLYAPFFSLGERTSRSYMSSFFHSSLCVVGTTTTTCNAAFSPESKSAEARNVYIYSVYVCVRVEFHFSFFILYDAANIY